MDTKMIVSSGARYQFTQGIAQYPDIQRPDSVSGVSLGSWSRSYLYEQPATPRRMALFRLDRPTCEGGRQLEKLIGLEGGR